MTMSENEGTEKQNVRQEIVGYFERKAGYRFQRFGMYKKIILGGRTGLYIVEAMMEDNIKHYALVTVNRASPQGIIILNSEQISRIMKAFVDGLTEAF